MCFSIIYSTICCYFWIYSINFIYSIAFFHCSAIIASYFYYYLFISYIYYIFIICYIKV